MWLTRLTYVGWVERQRVHIVTCIHFVRCTSSVSSAFLASFSELYSPVTYPSWCGKQVIMVIGTCTRANMPHSSPRSYLQCASWKLTNDVLPCQVTTANGRHWRRSVKTSSRRRTGWVHTLKHEQLSSRHFPPFVAQRPRVIKHVP